MFNKLIYKRSMMIALAVFALMTLTAGVAAAASMKAKKIEAIGGVGGVGLDLGATVESKFKIKDGVIKSVKISTVDEEFGGLIAAVLDCEDKGKHNEGACGLAGDILTFAIIESSHTSKATLKVIAHDAGTIIGTLKGTLKADLKITGGNGEVLDGTAKLKIKSSALPSAYSCLLGVDPGFGLVFGLLDLCIASPGPNAVGIYVGDIVGAGTGVYPLDPTAGPVLIPVELHVVDTGKFKVSSATTEIKGKISVTSNVVGGVASGPIVITKASAKFAEDED